MKHVKVPIYIEKTDSGYLISLDTEKLEQEEIVMSFEKTLPKALKKFGKTLKAHVKTFPESKIDI